MKIEKLNFIEIFNIAGEKILQPNGRTTKNKLKSLEGIHEEKACGNVTLFLFLSLPLIPHFLSLSY